jgi:glycosyltransferase involved in cell wall biosynthesis
MRNHLKLSICIPVYNSEKTIRESIDSAIRQTYPSREILVIDDCSTDKTVDILKEYGDKIRLIINEKNIGIGMILSKLMKEAAGKYVVFLCGDDQFTNTEVTRDIVKIFDTYPKIGVVGRYYYQYMTGIPGAIMVCREKNIFLNCCNPSGMAFRKQDVFGCNDIFIEVPFIVAQYLPDWEWTMMEYDTIKARIHPGGNTGTKKSYYKGSQIANWFRFIGPEFRFNQGFIQIKNRAPHLLWQEIKTAWRLTPGVRKEPSFYFFVGISLLVPGFILRPLSNFYRHRITRRVCKIIPRGE